MSSVQLKQGPWTVDELFALQDDKRFEIYAGEIHMVPSPMLTHQHASKELQHLLSNYIKAHEWGEIYYAPLGLILDDTNYVEPDLMCVSEARRHILKLRGIEGPPDLVVEILSPSTKTRDLGVKSAIYARFEVPNYWIVDPMACQVVTFELQDGAMHETGRFGDDDIFAPSLFPGLEIGVSGLWFQAAP